jgi:hypothetical protein
MAFKMSSSDAGQETEPRSYPLGSEGASGSAAPWRMLWPLTTLAVAALIIGWPWISGGFTIPWDAKATFQPQIQFLAQSLAGGQSPFWLPFAFSGHPQIADPQAMIFSPPFLLLALFTSAPSLWAVDMTLLGAVLASAAALMLWFRDQRWHWAGALMAALVFGYGASMAWRIQHIGQVLSLAYMPMAMLCLERAMARRSIVYGAAAGVIAAAIVLGRDQVALLVTYVLIAFVLWRLCSSEQPREAVRACLPALGAGALLASLLVIVPVVLTALLAAESNRPSIDFLGAGRGSLHPALLLTLVAPEVFGVSGRMEDYWGPPSFAWADSGLFLAQNMGQLYIGAIPLILIIMAALRGRLWAPEIRFFTLAAGAALLYALGWYTPVFRLLYELLPGVSLYRRPADAAFLIGALSAILAGYSTHRLFKLPLAELTRWHVFTVLGLIAAAFEIAIGLGWWLGRLPNLVLPLGTAAISFAAGAALLALARRRIPLQPVAAAAMIVAFTTADLAYNNGPNGSTALPPETYDVLQPNTANATIAFLKSRVVRSQTRRDRIELVGLGFHWPNASLTHGFENTLGYNPIRLGLYSAATGAEDTVGLPEQRKFAPLFPSYRSTQANLLGLRFIATGVPIETIDRTLKAGDLPLVARTADAYVYENPAAMDRVLFATAARPADFGRMLRDGVWPDADLRTTVLLERAPATSASRPAGWARIVSYRNTEVVVEAESPAGGWVVLNDLWHPWWFAEVDGRPAELLKANVLFRAVAVPEGRQIVRFIFRPVAGAWKELTGRSRTAVREAGSVHPSFSPAMASIRLARTQHAFSHSDLRDLHER